MKLKKDFGVRALCMTILLVGILTISGMGLAKGSLDYESFLAVGSGWVIAIIAFYFPRK